MSNDSSEIERRFHETHYSHRGSRGSVQPTVDPLELIRAAFRHPVLLILPVLLAVVGFAIYITYVPPQYAASSQLLLVVQKPNIVGSDAEAQGLDVTRYLIGPVIDSQVEIIRSDRISAQVIQQLRLHEDPDYTKQSIGLRSLIRSLLPLGGGEEADDGELRQIEANGEFIPLSVVQKFKGQLDVRRKGLTLILQITVEDEDPFRAAIIANEVSKVYLADQQSARRDVSINLTQQLGQRVDELREQLLARQAFLQDYIAENQLVSIGGLTVSEREIADTVSVLVQARALLAQQEAELAQLRASTGDNSAPLANDLNATLISDLQYEYETVKKKINILEEHLENQTAEFARKNKLAIRGDELEREVNATRDLYSALLLRLKETLVQGSILYPEARVIDAASVPLAPAGPGKAVLLLAALVAGGMLGVILALLRDQLMRPSRITMETQSFSDN